MHARASGRLAWGLRLGKFLGQKPAVVMSAIAERLVRRLSAAAQRNPRFIHLRRKYLAMLIDDPHWTFYDQRAAGTDANRDRRTMFVGRL